MKKLFNLFNKETKVVREQEHYTAEMMLVENNVRFNVTTLAFSIDEAREQILRDSRGEMLSIKKVKL